MKKRRVRVFWYIWGGAAALLCGAMSCTSNGGSLTKPSSVALAPYGSPVWAHDGQHLFFTHTPLAAIRAGDSGGPYQVFNWDSSGIWSTAVTGTNQKFLRQQLGSLSLSRDGRVAAIADHGKIFQVRVDADSLKFDTMALVGVGEWPSWSPDSKRMLCERSSGVWVVNVDDGSGSPLVGGSMALYPDWHPAHDLALAYSKPSANSDSVGIVEYDITGVRAPRLVRVGFVGLPTCGSCRRYYAPQYSPDGRLIAWVSQDAYTGGNVNVWVMNADGTSAHAVTSEGVLPEAFSWSPDGGRIAYVSYRSSDFTAGNGTIWIVDITTGRRYQVTFNLPSSVN